ncbi:MAG TPA: DUF5335 family protein [Verrucomicrobiae bacterium]|jgi:hypothetical protein
MTNELPQKFWRQFCERLSETYRGAVSIRFAGPNRGKKLVTEEAPLRSITLQQQNECSDALVIEAGGFDERILQHLIVEPIRIVLWQDNESGRYNHLQILAEAGTTEIDFHPGLDSGILERMAA